MNALVFLDTETSGLSLSDDIWEIAAVRREPMGQETVLHCFVEHDPTKCDSLPAPFLANYRSRFDPERCLTRYQAATRLITLIGDDRPHIVGAVPNFDTERISLLLRSLGLLAIGEQEPWHHHLIDIEALAVGYLAGRAHLGSLDAGLALPFPGESWDSDALSRAVGVEPPGPGVRHTAMGDVRWTIAVYDAVMGQ